MRGRSPGTLLTPSWLQNSPALGQRPVGLRKQSRWALRGTCGLTPGAEGSGGQTAGGGALGGFLKEVQGPQRDWKRSERGGRASVGAEVWKGPLRDESRSCCWR